MTLEATYNQVKWKPHSPEPFYTYRKQVSFATITKSRISSRVTYHLRMRELHRYGYIDYIPTYNYYRGSAVQLLRGLEKHQALEPGFNRM